MISKKASGQSLAEFAITLPLLFLLVMGIFDFGRGIYYYSTIQNAAHEAARYGAVNHCDDTGIIERATSMAIGLGTGLTVLEPELIYEEDSGALDYIRVTVIYRFEPVTPLIAQFFGEDGYIDLQSEARQLVEVESICPDT
jgi:Flp pilus assembly protein TadG